MNEVDRIRDQLKRAFYGNAWHGPSLREVLDGVTSVEASSRISTGHSIRELVLHITAWTDICRQRLAETPVPEATTEEDWPAVEDLDEAQWRRDVENLFAAEERLQEALSGFPESSLNSTVPGREHSYYVMLQGGVQHCLYHAGQITILKKLNA
ncbi:MAG: DinB family protein [Vicinamibacteria bacterium]